VRVRACRRVSTLITKVRVEDVHVHHAAGAAAAVHPADLVYKESDSNGLVVYDVG
jgi:hypothetical protein